MSKGEVLIQYGWLIALVLGIGTISWVVLILQAIFHDKRIALVGVCGSLLFSFTFLFPQLIPLLIKFSATALCVLFFIWFVIKNYHKKEVYLSALGVVLSTAAAFWLYQSYTLAE